MPSDANVLDPPATPAAAATPAPAQAEPPKDAAPVAPATDATTDTPAATDPAAPADAGKDPAAAATDPAKPAPTSLVEDDEADPATDPAKPADADKDAKPTGAEWADVRKSTIDRQLAKAKASLEKTVSAADLPKELAKIKSRMESQLGRYGSLEDALLAGWNAQEKLRSGKVKEALPDGATPEEVAEWRQANGIPDAPEKYEILPVDGHKWSEADQPALQRLKQMAHSMNLGGKEVNGIAALYAGLVQEAKEAQEERLQQIDRQDLQSVRDTLRDELKSEYKHSVTLMKQMLEDSELFPDGLGGELAQVRLSNQTRLINHPAFVKFMIETARERRGEGGFISGGEAAAFQSEKAELEALMNSDISTYQSLPWKSSGKTGSERYLELMREEQSRGRRR